MDSFNLDKYLIGSYYYQYPTDIEVSSITFNSKEVVEKSIFVAIKGFKSDGNNYIEEAINNGASLIITDTLPSKEYKDVGILMVKAPRQALAILSRRLYNYPDKQLKIIAVTGTDGKTSTSFYIYSLLKLLEYKVGLINTTYLDTNNKLIPSPYRQSTPDSNILFKLIRECTDNNKEYLVLEATSHALSPFFNRLANINIDIAVISTITHEHLDFHKSEENYLQTKLSIIDLLKENGIFITTKNNNQLEKCVSRAIERKKKYYIVEGEIDYKIITNNQLKPIIVKYLNKEYITSIYLPIFISNLMLASLCVNKITNIQIETIFSLFHKIDQIAGRFNIIENKIGRTLIIDFAHTSDALIKVLSDLKKLNKRIIVLFGCGGERDISKRYEMGKVAAQYSDIIILSEEDPRFEDNNKIMNDIESGIKSINNNLVPYKINNRTKAIEKAISISKKNDIILFLGKGHESTIERNGIKYPYNEKNKINEVINKIYGQFL